MATIRIASAPSSSASRTWVVTTSAISAIFSSVIRPLRLRVLVEPRVGALLHHLAELALLGLGDQHARRIRADVDRRAEHCAIDHGKSHGCATPESGLVTAMFTSRSPRVSRNLRVRAANLATRWPSSRAPGAAAPLASAGPGPMPLAGRLGLSVPHEWWASAPLLKSYEAAGFAWVQLHSPPASVLGVARLTTTHALARGRGALDHVAESRGPRALEPARRDPRRRPRVRGPALLRGGDRRGRTSSTTPSPCPRAASPSRRWPPRRARWRATRAVAERLEVADRDREPGAALPGARDRCRRTR